MSQKKNEIDIMELQALNPQETQILTTVAGTTPNKITTLKVKDKDGDEVILMTKQE